MAEATKTDATLTKDAEIPKDPISQGSLLWPAFLSLIALIVSTLWALYDEGFSRRPYKRYQDEWLEVARNAYGTMLSDSEAEYRRVTGSEEHLALEETAKSTAETAAPIKARLDDEFRNVVMPRLAVLAEPVKIARSEAAALTYRVEHAAHDGDAASEREYKTELQKIHDRQSKIHFPGEAEPVSWNFAQMVAEFDRLKVEQGRIQGEMAAASKVADEAAAKLKAYREAYLKRASPEAIRGLLSSVDDDVFLHEIKQIHIKVGDGELIERCESCHLGIRSPVPLGLAEVSGRKEFTSHPRIELLKAHDPESFGCSPCHGGNGIATMSVGKAHGRYKHWLWPMHYPENIEAGCQQCHTNDLYLEGADLFNKGKDLFYQRGCHGCHRYEGFNREAEEQKLLEKNLDTSKKRVLATEIEIARLTEIAENSNSSPEQVEKAYADAPGARQSLHLAHTEEKEIAAALRALDSEVKRVGPNLKDVSAKLKPEWIMPWLTDPRAFRHDTKMPRFRVTDDQAASIAAYLWQNSDPTQFAEVEPGDAERGQSLVISRGCLGCHQVKTDEFDLIGNDFAANLSRLGEKANFAYIVSWIQNPRVHNKYAVMPSLRLTEQDARDIATWLTSLKADGATYVPADQALAVLKDKERFAKGEDLVKHLGCAGCHEIQGLGNEGRIGVELTQEGSKPLERLDFGTQTHDFAHRPDPRHPGRKSQYDHKGFFENKLRNPAIWDKGKLITEYKNRLKMPNFWIRPGEPGYEESKDAIESDIDALTTFILGSVEVSIPASLTYRPTGAEKDIQDGWWVIKKYNCDGCHQINAGEMPAIWKLPIYQDGASFAGVPAMNGRPPTLVGEGSRVDPAWLSNFLLHPALASTPEEQYRNGVRQALAVRMPTFYLSERERMKIVRFFIAMSKLSPNYVRPAQAPLVGEELDLARAAFTAGDCANCHLLGGETNVNPETTYAPSFSPVAERIRPSWTHKWVTEPNAVIPGTAMPAILNKQADGRWMIAKPSAAGAKRVGEDMLNRLKNYAGNGTDLLDHADLLVRYFAQWNSTEAEYQKAQRLK